MVTNEEPLVKPDMPLVLRRQQEIVSVVGSFNDLILCRVGTSNQSVYYICNLQTKQYMATPPSPLFRHHLHLVCVGFICEPFYTRNNKANVENARLRVNLDYRVRVVLVPAFPVDVLTYPGELEVKIFASETGLWSEHRLPGFRGDVNSILPKKLVATKSGHMMLLFGEMNLQIVEFDPFMATQNNMTLIRSQVMRMPRVAGPLFLWPWTQLIPSQGQLFLSRILLTGSRTTSKLIVWVLKKTTEGKQWELFHQTLHWKMKARAAATLEDHQDDGNGSDKDCSRCWVASFLKALAVYRDGSMARSSSQRMWMHCVGHHPNNEKVMIFQLYASDRGSEVMASYNMRTKCLRLVSKPRVRLISNTVVPVVLPPWPTPLPKLYSVQVEQS